MIVTLTAIPSAIGSAKYTAITLLLIIEGRMKINGIRRITFLAVIIFSLVIFLNHLSLLSAVATEIIDIAGWVFMWEAVDLFFIERPLNKYELLKNHKLVEAVVNYCDDN